MATYDPLRKVIIYKNGCELYVQTCAACHGATGKGGPMGGAPLTGQLTTERIMTAVSNGLNAMPAFGTMYSREDMHDLSGYILQELVKN